MFKKKNEKSMAGSNNETIIAQGVRVEGEFVSDGHVVIEGELTGSVQTAQSLRIGEDAKINADVTAATAVIAGEVQGNIKISDRLEILESSVIHGDIDVHILSVSPGAKLNGRITMNDNAKSSSTEDSEE